MKKYYHERVVDIPIYPGKLVIILSNDKKRLNKQIPVLKANNLYAHSLYHDYKRYNGFYLILNFNNSFKKIQHGTITHESLHIANFIANYCGFVADLANDEPLAYIAGWITDHVYEFMNKKGFRI